jgi:hypothetical protein
MSLLTALDLEHSWNRLTIYQLSAADIEEIRKIRSEVDRLTAEYLEAIRAYRKRMGVAIGIKISERRLLAPTG